jgi:4-hydroxy-4-methyl-2-oxoglutarate aldolase
MGDDDGVLVVPAELAGEVADRALDILERDKKLRRRMYEQLGIPPDETVQ